MTTKYIDENEDRVQTVLDILKQEYKLPIGNIFKLGIPADIHIAKYEADEDDEDIDPDYKCFCISIQILTSEFPAIFAVLFWRLLWVIALPFKIWSRGWSRSVELYNMIRFIDRDENNDVFLQLIYLEEDDPNTPLFEYIDENFEFDG